MVIIQIKLIRYTELPNILNLGIIIVTLCNIDKNLFYVNAVC